MAVLGATTAKNLFGGDDPIEQGDQDQPPDLPRDRRAGGQGRQRHAGRRRHRAGPHHHRAEAALWRRSVGFGVGSRVSTIYVSAVSEAQVDAAIAQITEILRERHKTTYQNDDFTVTSQKDILGVFDQITGLMTAFLGAIAAISLVVGGIGIMNIMLVSVTERTREIGIRKAVGAKRRDILVQFLVEAVVLSVLGGLGGIAIGWGIGQLVNALKIGVAAAAGHRDDGRSR